MTEPRQKRFSLVEIALLTGILGSQGYGLKLDGKSVEANEQTASSVLEIKAMVEKTSKRLDDHETSIRRQDMAIQTLSLQLGELERRISLRPTNGRIR